MLHVPAKKMLWIITPLFSFWTLHVRSILLDFKAFYVSRGVEATEFFTLHAVLKPWLQKWRMCFFYTQQVLHLFLPADRDDRFPTVLGLRFFWDFWWWSNFFQSRSCVWILIVCSTKIKHGWKCYFVGMLGSTPVAKKSWPKRNTWFHWTRIGGGGRCEISWWVSLEVKYFLQEFFSKWSRTTECLELIPRSFGLI